MPEFQFDMPDSLTGEPLIYKGRGITVTAAFFKPDDSGDYFYLSVLCDKPNFCMQLAFTEDLKVAWAQADFFTLRFEKYSGRYNFCIRGNRTARKAAKMLERKLIKMTTSLPIKPCPACNGTGLAKHPISSAPEHLLDDSLICPMCHLSGCLPIAAPQKI